MTRPILARVATRPLILAAVLLTTGAALQTETGAARAATAKAKPRSETLTGTFKLKSGVYINNAATGSYWRMLYPDSTQYFENPDSTSSNKIYTAMQPGTDGGLVTGKYQPLPVQPFEANGNAVASAIVESQLFTGVKYGIFTVPVDPNTGKKYPKPNIYTKNGRLYGQTEAIIIAWDKLYFHQGTNAVSGTYNAKTHAFLLEWKDTVVGGPFDGFTGVWHLEGTFVPQKTAKTKGKAKN
jgi:hypothetical protein